MEIQQFSLSARLDYTPQSMEQFVQFCEDAISNITDNRQARFVLKTAVDELTLNALEHGYERTAGIVTVCMERCEAGIHFEISDFGKGIPPGRIRLDRIAREDSDLRSRGWAYSILNQLSDGLEITSNDPHGARISLTVPL